MTQTIQEIMIYGAGGFARELEWLIQECNEKTPQYKMVCYIDDNVQNHGSLIRNVPVMGLEQASERFPSAVVSIGIGSPLLREKITQKIRSQGHAFANLRHPQVMSSRNIVQGEGLVICAGSILTTDIELGEQVQINLSCTIGHDVKVGDYTTFSPGAQISGWVHLGKRVFVGTGAVIINGTSEAPLVIADDVVIGAGACVNKSLLQAGTYVGVPARMR